MPLYDGTGPQGEGPKTGRGAGPCDDGEFIEPRTKEDDDMPFQSEAQRKHMYANDPAMAREWENKTPKNKKLPEKVTRKSYQDMTEEAIKAQIAAIPKAEY